ncbi:SGT1-domain-containing protein [Pleurotus eryngii]|uniref:SGT1-domain-containing protein n=1 Tax=Pleurotus eryngii TaxID=5323 RepID=A0A9P6A1A7_PLEER|nr:SGT1-domain-containing protein [Pleurotus eryngii]
MDIFNRPPTISDDTLQYTLYPPAELADQVSVTSFAACIASFVETLLLPSFIWHKESFELKAVSDPGVANRWLLEGRMRVGDCVDDEWCVVWLFKEISAKWDLAISVFDSDGEFLLIEAAEGLPKWVTPGNSENRVWIYGSRLHLIPLSHISPPSRPRKRRRSHDSDDEGTAGIAGNDDGGWIAVEDALKLIFDRNVNTLAPPEVERLVWKRISGYPAATKNHVHMTKAWIPTDIARALSVDASLVQKAVEAFYTRDATQLRAAHRMSRFPPESSVLTSVKMTRTAYAQLVGQKFYPPKIFGRWSEKEGTPERRWREVGMKLACGFEMLYQETKKILPFDNSSVEAYKSELNGSGAYKKYIDNLKNSTYFRGEAEGSVLWKELEKKAADIYVMTLRVEASRPTFASSLTKALSQSSDTVPAVQSVEDPDDWLIIDSDSFDQMLERSMSGNKAKDDTAMDVDSGGITAEDQLANEQAVKLRSLASKVEEFVEGQGDLEGARFADEASDDEEFSDGMPSTDSGDSDDESDINISDRNDKVRDTDNREDAAHRQAAMDNLIPGILPSEYGKMPASFHSNSQRVARASNDGDTEGDTDPRGAAGRTPEGRQTVGDDNIDKLYADSRMDKAARASVSSSEKPIRQPILPRDQYDGVVDSDDETDEEEEEEDEEDQPQLVGDIEVDMGEEEEEFLEFARQTLGINDEQWESIIKDRTDRGAFVPTSARELPTVDITSQTTPQTVKEGNGRTSTSEQRPNSKLDSFDAVMQALDAELSRSSNKSTALPPRQHTAADKGKGKEHTEFSPASGLDKILEGAGSEYENEDIEKAMEAELKAALEKEGDGEGDNDFDGDGGMDYNLIKNFLESFKSQAGLSGPVGNLAGRLQHGWLPRDET